MKRRNTGYTLVEMMIAGLVSVVLGSGIVQLVRGTYTANSIILNQNTAQASTRSVIDTLADQLRGASAVTAGAASDITFTDPVNGTIRYWKTGTTLKKSVNGQPTAGTTVATNISTLYFVYHQYTTAGGWATGTLTPAVPANVAAVSFVANTQMTDGSRQITGSVQIRDKRP